MARTAPDRLAALRAAFAGRYDIERPAGEGGMATVWLARDVKHDRHVAVKVLRRELGASIGAERFAREISITARFNHPNIVPVLDSGVVELGDLRLPWYSMPFVEGPSLRDHLTRNGPLPLDEALRYAGEVADALDFAHARGVVHRDVKPGNILLQAGHALVADFGIARAVDVASRAATSLTAEGMLGTPVYMSPEQCRGEERLDGRSDIYSLGCVMYEMLGGAPPFDATTPQQVSLAHCTQPPPALEERRPGVPVAVVELVDRALEKRPADRWATAGEFRAEIERVRARTSGRTEVVTPVTRPRRWVPAALAAALVVAGFGGWLRWRRDRAEIRPVEGGVVVLAGFRDRTGGELGRVAERLDDALRQELRRAPMLTVVDVSAEPELPVDSLRRRHRADFVIRAALDRSGDSVGATMRVLDGASGRELGGGSTWRAGAAELVPAATGVDSASAFAAVRATLARELANRRASSLERDTAVLGLVTRAAELQRTVNVAFYQVGPTRSLADLAAADSVLAGGERRHPRSVLLPLARARLQRYIAAVLASARDRFPDSTALPAPLDAALAAVRHADRAVALAPGLPDGWYLRADVRSMAADFGGDPSLVQLALADVRQASNLNPYQPEIWQARGELEAQTGDVRGALYSIRKAQAADVFLQRAATLDRRRFELEMMLQQFDSAAATCMRSRTARPWEPQLLTCQSEVAGARSRRVADAVAALELADSLAASDRVGIPGSTVDELRLLAAAILWRAGLADSGERVFTRTVAGWPATPWPPSLLTAAYARMVRGDTDSALAIAALSVRLNPALAGTYERQPRYASLRSHPAFRSAMRGIPPSEASAGSER